MTVKVSVNSGKRYGTHTHENSTDVERDGEKLIVGVKHSAGWDTIERVYNWNDVVWFEPAARGFEGE